MNKKAIYILIFSCLIIIGLFLSIRKTSGVEFNSEEWKNWKETEMKISLRWDMMNSLRQTHNLLGKSKTEIIKLLGEPKELKTNSTFRYYLGMAKHGIDIGNLVIEFDKNGRVIKYYVWRG